MKVMPPTVAFQQPTKPVYQGSGFHRSVVGVKPSAVHSPRFGLGPEWIVFLTSSALGAGGLISAITVAITSESRGQYREAKNKAAALANTLEQGQYKLLGEPKIKRFENRYEKQVDLDIGGKRYTFTRIAVKDNPQPFLSGASMEHFLLKENNNHLFQLTEYSNPQDDKKNGKRAKSLRVIYRGPHPTQSGKIIVYEGTKEKQVPKSIRQLFEAVENAIREAQARDKDYPDLNLFSIEAQLFK